jgi:IS605 OrfB family transposase
LGVSALATLSTGETIPGPKPHKALLARLRRLSKSLSRKQKGSANRAKAKAKLAKLHARIAAIRQDALHKLTTSLTRRFHTIAVENLNVRGMLANRHLARSIADMSFFEFRRQLEYKAAMRGGQVVVADRFYASSKTCSACGHTLVSLPPKSGVLGLVENVDKESRDDSEAGACAVHAGIQVGGGAPGASRPSHCRGGQGLGHPQGQPGQLGAQRRQGRIGWRGH